ncbi:hypothetical protein AXX17_AT5G34640 [Arabidopsis thaliana]|uniref:Uncharacterized protein n=1 Tax=Arabidopsis thaliana TaxID=3702 RepID=A0A178UI42_ARATH|nr:hypothetical protein AXX17_AT5G34640 [Arabidopsis thaliana]
MVDDTSPFLEVFCEVSGKDYRFTTGTKAEFAVSVINRKLGSLKPRVIYIEAAKEGEEPISFGDNASLLNYGLGWKLKTVVDADLPGTEKNNRQQRFSSVFSTFIGLWENAEVFCGLLCRVLQRIQHQKSESKV